MSFAESAADLIKAYLENVSYGTPRIIADDLQLNYNTVRGALYRLVRSGIVERPIKGVYVISEIWYRHYLAATRYCSGKEKQFYALTFDTDNASKEDELLNKILEETENICGSLKNYHGEEVIESTEGKDDGNTYPEIEVGQL